MPQVYAASPAFATNTPSMPTDFLIVGGGLAGACAALWLTDHGSVTLVEAERPATGASGAAAGLVNPLMGRKAKPAWRFEEALDALHATFDRTDAAPLFRPGGLLRPARDARQAELFRARTAALPAHADWLSPDALRERYPDLAAPHGGLWVKRGGAVDLTAAVEAFVRAAETAEAEVRTGVRITDWGETDAGAWAATDTGERIEASVLLLALGDGFRRFPELAALGLHRIKGQTIRLARPPGLGAIPPLSGFGYVVPTPALAQAGGNTLVVGSSYEHEFADTAPSAAQSEALRASAAQMLPALADAPILDARAGVRVTVPGDRMPVLGPLPGRRRVWTFTGLGSKGLLTAPLLARALPSYFADPETLPAAVRVGRRSSR